MSIKISAAGNRKLTVARFAAILVGALAIQTVHGQAARDIAKRVAPAVVLLVMEDANGQPLAMGSGFIVQQDDPKFPGAISDDGVVATNLHVIAGAARGYAKLSGQKQKHNIMGIVALDAVRDLVLLRVEGTTMAGLPIGDSKKLAVGDEIYAVGNPRGLEGTFSAGIVSSIREIGNDSLLQITAPISPGSSGGPVVNSNGEVVGVAAATYKGGQNLNFAIPSAYLSALAQKAGPPAPLSGRIAANKPATKSILEDAGGRSTDGVTAGQFLWDDPDSFSSGGFTATIRSQLRKPIKGVVCLVVFYGTDGQPLDTVEINVYQTIPPGLAKRISGHVDSSVKRLTSTGGGTPHTKLDFRILDFEFADSD